MRIGTDSKETLQNFCSMSDSYIDEMGFAQAYEPELRDALSEVWDIDIIDAVRRKLWGHNAEPLRDYATAQECRVRELTPEYTPPLPITEYNTFTTGDVSFESWQPVLELPIDELKKLRVHYRATHGPASEYGRICDGFLYYNTGNLSYFEDAFNLDNRGDSYLTVTQQKQRLAKVFDEINPIIGSLLFGYIKRVSTNSSDSDSRYGSAKDNARWLNIISDTKAGGVSTVAHEVGHAIQYAFGISSPSDIDNRDCDDETEKDYTVEVDENGVKEFQTDIEYLWDCFIDDSIETVRDYQQKNFNEFFACAFEYWWAGEATQSYNAFFTKHLAR